MHTEIISTIQCFDVMQQKCSAYNKSLFQQLSENWSFKQKLINIKETKTIKNQKKIQQNHKYNVHT